MLMLSDDGMSFSVRQKTLTIRISHVFVANLSPLQYELAVYVGSCHISTAFSCVNTYVAIEGK